MMRGSFDGILKEQFLLLGAWVTIITTTAGKVGEPKRVAGEAILVIVDVVDCWSG
jgi:hypothetical protein